MSPFPFRRRLSKGGDAQHAREDKSDQPDRRAFAVPHGAASQSFAPAVETRVHPDRLYRAAEPAESRRCDWRHLRLRCPPACGSGWLVLVQPAQVVLAFQTAALGKRSIGRSRGGWVGGSPRDRIGPPQCDGPMRMSPKSPLTHAQPCGTIRAPGGGPGRSFGTLASSDADDRIGSSDRRLD